jgi:hypothetical protein
VTLFKNTLSIKVNDPIHDPNYAVPAPKNGISSMGTSNVAVNTISFFVPLFLRQTRYKNGLFEFFPSVCELVHYLPTKRIGGA